MKKLLCGLYIILIVVMAAATIIEKYQGSAYTSSHVYGSWWFSLLWGLLAGAGIAWIIKQRMRRWPVVVLHLSFVIILLGAFFTHISSVKGMIHLRQGETTTTYITEDMAVRQLPFALRLEQFDVKYHEGTMAAADYESQITVVDGDHEEPASISMNNIFAYHGYRLYQSSYDDDMRGSILALNSDPWGIPVTYCGYALLFFALIWMLIDPQGTYRNLLRKARTLVCMLLLLAQCLPIHASTHPTTFPKETAEKFGQLYILYNNRICPTQTYALDFTKKLYGKTHYGDYTAEQVLAGFIFWNDEWMQEDIIKVKSGALKSTLQLPDHCSVNTFFNKTMGGYILGSYIREYYHGNHDAFHKDAAKMDDRLMLVMELQQGTPLKQFPVTENGATRWYGPTEVMPSSIDTTTQQFVRDIYTLINEQAQAGQFAQVDAILEKMLKYQQKNAGRSLPTDSQTKAEHLYNRIPFATILFMFNLTMGFLLLGLFIWHSTRPVDVDNTARPVGQWLLTISKVLLVLSFLCLTMSIVLRWVIKGSIPMSNGYESMLLMAWFIMILSLMACRRFQIALCFGFLLSGFFLLVSHINQMDPQIGHLMPVLNSPLLAMHVSIIMMAFALLAMTFICGLAALVMQGFQRLFVKQKTASTLHTQLDALALLSRLFLYPALTTLGLGIFIGAIWANISWGTYWSWDPKETWALITFMTYAVVVHTQTFPVFRRPLAYHFFVTLAFLTILMTYFGVNYFLGGMHSYA